jgi:hypothetical protein
VDLYEILRQLHQERKRITEIIKSLESLAAGGRKKRGRKSMNSAERRRVSERMKRYWAKRRKAASAAN